MPPKLPPKPKKKITPKKPKVFKIPDYPSIKWTNFKGSVKVELGLMLYLSYKHTDNCFPIIFDKKMKYKGPRISGHDFAMVWRVTDDGWQLNKTKKFAQAIKQCKKRFVTIFIPLLPGEMTPQGPKKFLKEGGHANMIIVDKKRKEAERYEPHGKKHWKTYNTFGLDIALLEFFEKLGFKYIAPTEFCPPKSHQMLEGLEKMSKGIKISGEPGGYCVAWSYWYADLRLTYPDMPRQLLIHKSIKELRKNPLTFTQYIANFASFFQEFDFLNYHQIDQLARALAGN